MHNVRNLSWIVSVITGVSAWAISSRVSRNSVAIVASTSAITALFGLYLNRRTTFEKDPVWKLEQYKIAENAIFEARTGLMKIGMTQARKQYGHLIEDADMHRWLASDFSKRSSKDIPPFHGEDLKNRSLFTDQLSMTLIQAFKALTLISSESVATLSSVWEEILKAHGLDEPSRKAHYLLPTAREAIRLKDYSLLRSNGNIADVWQSLNALQQRELKGAFISYVLTQKLSLTTVCTDYLNELETMCFLVPPPDEHGYYYTKCHLADRVWSGREFVRNILHTAVQNGPDYASVRNETFALGSQYFHLLDETHQQIVRYHFLDQPASLMVQYKHDRHLFRITTQEQHERLNRDFESNPIAAWIKHGLEPIQQGIITSAAGKKLLAELDSASEADIATCMPLVKAFGVEQKIHNHALLIAKPLFSLTQGEFNDVAELIERFKEGDPRLEAWRKKGLEESAAIPFHELWSKHRAYFTARILLGAEFRDRFLAEIQGQSFLTIVETYGLECLDPKVGLVTAKDPVICHAVGNYLLKRMELPVNLGQLDATLTALETYGFFPESLKTTIARASVSLCETVTSYRQSNEQKQIEKEFKEKCIQLQQQVIEAISRHFGLAL